MSTPTIFSIASRRIRGRMASDPAAAIACIVCACRVGHSHCVVCSVPQLSVQPTPRSAKYYADSSRGAPPRSSGCIGNVVSDDRSSSVVCVVRGRRRSREPSVCTALLLEPPSRGQMSLSARRCSQRQRCSSQIGEPTPDPAAVSVTRAAAAVVLSVFAPRIPPDPHCSSTASLGSSNWSASELG